MIHKANVVVFYVQNRCVDVKSALHLGSDSVTIIPNGMITAKTATDTQRAKIVMKKWLFS